MTAGQIGLVLFITLIGVQCLNITIPTSCGDVNLANLTCAMCENNSYTWYDATFSNAGVFHVNSSWRFERNVLSWDSICSWGHDVVSRITRKLPECNNQNIGREIMNKPESFYFAIYSPPVEVCGSCGSSDQARASWERLVDFYRRVCDGAQVKPSLKQVITDPSFDSTTKCMDGRVRRDMYRCYSSLLQRFAETGRILDFTNITAIASLDKLAASVLNCMYSVLNKSPCNPATRRVMYKVTRLQAPSSLLYQNVKYDETSTEIEISFKTFRDGNLLATYNVSDGNLETTFQENGGTVVGTGNDRVEIRQGLGNRTRFVQKSTGTVLILRQWQGNYFFTLRTAQSIVQSSSGLLIDGCPADQIVTADSVRIRLRRQATESQCTLGCVEAVDGWYYASCLIDCLVLRDVELATSMSIGAMEDEELVVTLDDEVREGAYSPGDVGDGGDGGDGNGGGKGGATTRGYVSTFLAVCVVCSLVKQLR